MGFKPTPAIVRLESGTSRAATRKNAAEDRSPGMRTSPPRSFAGPCTEMTRFFTETSAPNWRNASSVWSRVRTGSRTVVVPSANRPANRTHVLTWALATGSV